MDPSILLQKQIRDNSQDLQNEFFDMKAWEEQMKRKDAQLQNADEPILPPIRSKKLIKKPTTNQEEKTKPKRIKSYNYDEWNKFDAEGACKAVDDDEKITEIVEEIPSKEELETKHKEALKFKNEGNTFVKQQLWIKAIPCYSNAIKIFPGDATFYANRALCHLKIDNLYSAESDCTGALQLDDSYVKAYHRRASARMGLKQYKDAKRDIEKVLILEPSNKEALAMLSQVNKKLASSKPIVVTSSDVGGQSVEAKIGRKLWGEISDTESEQKKASTVQSSSNGIRTPVEKEDETDELPLWLPKLKKDVSVVKTVKKLPHQQNQKPLKRIPIKLLGPGMSIFDGLVEETATKKKVTAEVESKEIKKVTPKIVTVDEPVEIPPEPITSVQFLFHWKKNKSDDFRYQYLTGIAAEKLPDLFKDSMESDTFSDILSALKTSFIPKKSQVFPYLESLSKIKRFRTLTMFMTKTDQASLNDLFEYCKHSEKRPEKEVDDLKSKYAE